MNEMRELVAEDFRNTDPRLRSIYRVWPDFPVNALIDQSIATVKGDAARRSFDAMGKEITWAVIDSGVDNTHPHFSYHENLKGPVEGLHRDFTGGESPCTDELGHGTHVAGIIAGGLPADHPAEDVFIAKRVAVGD